MYKSLWQVLTVACLILVATACGPSQTELDATATKIAADVFATQTAGVPTATLTYTPSPTATTTPTSTATPTVTPTPTDTPTITPTSAPALMAMALTQKDLPEGFRVMTAQEMGPVENNLPDNAVAFGFSDDGNNQVILGYLVPYSSQAEQGAFDNMLPQMVDMFATAYGATTKPEPIDGLDYLGESRIGFTFLSEGPGLVFEWDNILFRRGDTGVYLFVVHPDGDEPAAPANALALIMDGRLNLHQMDQAMLPAPTWRDEFDAELAGSWKWVNENSARWSLAEKPGYLRISVSHLATGAENLLLRPVAEVDFTIQTRVLIEPGTNFQFAGLVIYQDDKNFLQLGRAFCDLQNTCLGNGIYFDKILGGEFVGDNHPTEVENPLEVMLRLERRGTMIRAFYSSDGVMWIEIGTQWIPTDFKVNGVGLTASQDSNTGNVNIPADFDYFELTEGE